MLYTQKNDIKIQNYHNLWDGNFPYLDTTAKASYFAIWSNYFGVTTQDAIHLPTS